MRFRRTIAGRSIVGHLSSSGFNAPRGTAGIPMRNQVYVSIALFLSILSTSGPAHAQEPSATYWVGTASDGSRSCSNFISLVDFGLSRQLVL